jgi:hypothetical protein
VHLPLDNYNFFKVRMLGIRDMSSLPKEEGEELQESETEEELEEESPAS